MVELMVEAGLPVAEAGDRLVQVHCSGDGDKLEKPVEKPVVGRPVVEKPVVETPVVEKLVVAETEQWKLPPFPK